MKYYLIVGETSGELHASHLMRSLKYYDKNAQFRFIGGDMMKREGGYRVRHYKEMAYMGFIPVLMHLRTIFSNMDMVKRDIVAWQPDVVILVDYAGFNLNIAKYLKKNTNIPVYYYISPKIWAWKEHRIKAIKRDVDEMFSILPFEVDFFEKKHNYPVHYVGNPTADEVRLFCKNYNTLRKNFLRKRRLHPNKPIIALLAGSRKQEIKDNLPAMIEAASKFADSYQIVLACAPSVEDAFYDEVMQRAKEKGIKTSVVRRVKNATYPLLHYDANGNHNQRQNSFFLKNGAFVRLKNIELGYNLPSKWINHLAMSECRVFVNASNLITWDHLDDLVDPESAGSNKYPIMKTFNFGVNVRF
jgi:lipid-A-disaccharide synthase